MPPTLPAHRHCRLLFAFPMAVTRSRSRSAARAASASSRPQAPPPKARSKRGAPRANESAPNKQARVTHHAQRALAVAQPPSAAAPPHTEFYLFKSESESRLQNGHQMKFSIDDLRAERDGITHWDGVRNAEACNCMKRMNKGDMAFFYHSNTNKSRPSVVGVVRVVSDPYPGTSSCAQPPLCDHFHAAGSPVCRCVLFVVQITPRLTKAMCITMRVVSEKSRAGLWLTCSLFASFTTLLLCTASRTTHAWRICSSSSARVYLCRA